MSHVTGKPLGIYYEHPDWYRPLFQELDRRGVPYDALNADQHTYDPCERKPPHAVIFNRMPTPWEKSEANVYAGLASIFTTHKLRFWHMSRERMLEMIAQISCDQLIFGLDFPYNLEKETQIGLETLRSLNLPEADLDKILGGNLRRVLGLSND